eukprot:239582-Hanusia_phi.AAC.1
MAAQKNSMKKKKTKEETSAKGEHVKSSDDMSAMTDEKLKDLIQQSCGEINYLISLIPADTYRVPDVAERSKPLKYQKKVKETVSEKVLRAEKNAKKKAKFAVDRDGEAKEESDSDEGESEEEGDDDEVGVSYEAPRRAVVPGKRAKTPAELKELLEKKMSELQPKRKEGTSERAVNRKRKREEAKEKKKKQQEKDKKARSFVPIPSPMPKEKRQRKETEQSVSVLSLSRLRLTCSKSEEFSFGRMKMGGEDVIGGGKHKNKKYRDKPEKVKARRNAPDC